MQLFASFVVILGSLNRNQVYHKAFVCSTTCSFISSFPQRIVPSIRNLLRIGIFGLRNFTTDKAMTAPSDISILISDDTQCGKLNRLRQLMKLYNIDTYIVYSGDEHGTEITSAFHQRRAFISNFNGSAGVAVITLLNAALWTDGRYFLQAEDELDKSCGWILMKVGLPETPDISTWIINNNVKCVGIDPFTTSINSYRMLLGIKKKGISIKFMDTNLIDLMWTESRPLLPNNPLFIHSMKYAGISTSQKIQACRETLAKQEHDCLILTMLDEIAWLLNLRGSDLEYSPLFFSYFLMTKDYSILYTKNNRISEEVKQYLASNNIILKEYADIKEHIKNIIAECNIKKCLLSPLVNVGLYNLILTSLNKNVENPIQLDDILCQGTGKHIVLDNTPVAIAKSMKNDSELEGMKEAHVKDGIALTLFLYWIQQTVKSGLIEKETEHTLSQKLYYFRSMQEDFFSLSFPTISASGPNSAIIHYSADEKKCSHIKKNDLYLFDSGSQYFHGTTDITRTIHVSDENGSLPTDFQKQTFTLVLKGLISVSTTIFPKGTKGSQIDSFARRSLWNFGYDYRHGTGHGVGLFLNVHESPPNLSYAPMAITEKSLECGMVLSNEPGLYHANNCGVRIENLMFVKNMKFEKSFENMEFLMFEDLTLVPIQTSLIDTSLLSAWEIKWINEYNKRVCDVLTDRFKQLQNEQNNYVDVVEFLIQYTKPI